MLAPEEIHQQREEPRDVPLKCFPIQNDEQLQGRYEQRSSGHELFLHSSPNWKDPVHSRPRISRLHLSWNLLHAAQIHLQDLYAEVDESGLEPCFQGQRREIGQEGHEEVEVVLVGLILKVDYGGIGDLEDGAGSLELS